MHRKHYDEFVKRFAERAKTIPYGDPSDPSVIIGPIINGRQIEKILGFVELGKSEGAKLVLEGERVGNVLTPFVFADVKNDSKLDQHFRTHLRSRTQDVKNDRATRVSGGPLHDLEW